MVNHVRTLLLNESHLTQGVPGWCIDARFSKIDLKKSVAEFCSVLFSGLNSVQSRAKRVDCVIPFVYAPEFSSFISGLDPRVTVPTFPDVRTGTVPSFYKAITGDTFAFVDECLSSFSSSMLFQHTGDVDVDSKLDGLYTIKAESKETSKKFSACMVAVVLLLDLEYRNTQA